MSRFTAPLVVTPTADYKGWHVQHSTSNDWLDEYPNAKEPPKGSQKFRYEIGEEGSGLAIEPCSGFRTDFASIPWFARWLIKTWGRHTNAAIIHDWLYWGGPIEVDVMEMAHTLDGVRGLRKRHGINLPYPTRKQADCIMLEAMGVMGVKKWRRLIIYAGIRLGGWYSWRAKRKRYTVA